MITHNYISKKIQALLLSAISEVFQNYIPVNFPGKYICPSNYLKGQEVWHFLISPDSYRDDTLHP
jgi:hypothetical protein